MQTQAVYFLLRDRAVAEPTKNGEENSRSEKMTLALSRTKCDRKPVMFLIGVQ